MNITSNRPQQSFGALVIKPGATDCAENLGCESIPKLRKCLDKLDLFDLELTADGPQILGKKAGSRFVDKFELCSEVQPGSNIVTVDSFLSFNNAKMEAAIVLPYNNNAEAKQALAKLQKKKGLDLLAAIMEKLERDQKRPTRDSRPYFVG